MAMRTVLGDAVALVVLVQTCVEGEGECYSQPHTEEEKKKDVTANDTKVHIHEALGCLWVFRVCCCCANFAFCVRNLCVSGGRFFCMLPPAHYAASYYGEKRRYAM